MANPNQTADDASNRDTLILRDHLALERTRLANERTLLAYVRTAFMLGVSGVTALKVFAPTPTVMATAWSFIVIGVLVLLLGLWRFTTMRQAINRRKE
jgi:putative membrane protein